MDIAKYPMIESFIMNIQELGYVTGCMSTADAIIADIKKNFDRFGPYEFARQQNLLVNGSGEEFACQFMAFYNEYSGNLVY